MSIILYISANYNSEPSVLLPDQNFQHDCYLCSNSSINFPKCYTYTMLEITPTLSIEESELQFEYIRASGPGGQNVNKVSTAVQLRFNMGESSLPDLVKERLYKIAGGRINKDGVMIIHARQYRTQEQNRYDAQERLINLLKLAAERPKARYATRPSITARAARVSEKKQRGQQKRLRRYSPDDWE